MKNVILATVIIWTAGIAKAGDIERLKAGSDSLSFNRQTMETVKIDVKDIDFGPVTSVFESWDGLVQHVLQNGDVTSIPVPNRGTIDVRLRARGLGETEKPLEIMAVYGKSGSAAFEPEGLYFQVIYTMPEKTVSYVFLSSLAGNLSEAYMTVSPQDGSGAYPNTVHNSREMTRRFLAAKYFWYYSPIEGDSTPQHTYSVVQQINSAR